MTSSCQYDFKIILLCTRLGWMAENYLCDYDGIREYCFSNLYHEKKTN